jgi:formate-dependent nitrite reductase membrane component NrfD
MIDEKRLDELRRNAQPAQRADGYYGLPLLKPPVWTWEVPAYFFIGGAAGAAAVIGFAAQLTRADRRLVRDARWLAAGGAALSAPLLIADLGRPERFLYMLRVFKPQSAMSVGAWTLAIFGGATTAAALFDESALGNVASVFGAATGMVMATYTGVLLGATAIPVWSKNAGTLPANFAASATGAASSALQLLGHHERALEVIAFTAAACETYVAAKADSRHSTMVKVASALSGPIPMLLRMVGTKSRRARQLAALSAIAGSLITRFAWVEAGRKSADSWLVADSW